MPATGFALARALLYNLANPTDAIKCQCDRHLKYTTVNYYPRTFIRFISCKINHFKVTVTFLDYSFVFGQTLINWTVPTAAIKYKYGIAG